MADQSTAPSRHEKSLGLLTTKFVSLLQEAPDGVLDLKVVSLQNILFPHQLSVISLNSYHIFVYPVHAWTVVIQNGNLFHILSTILSTFTYKIKFYIIGTSDKLTVNLNINLISFQSASFFVWVMYFWLPFIILKMIDLELNQVKVKLKQSGGAMQSL